MAWECSKHGSRFLVTRKDKRIRCRKCSSQSVSSRRRKLRELIIEEFGNKCIDCNISGPPFIFDFDHREPMEKSFGISNKNIKSLDRIRAEASKCDLVCANCHRIRTHKQRCDGCKYCIIGR